MLRPPPLGIRPEVVDRVPAERARVAPAVLEPLVQADAVEVVVARAALLVRQRLVRRNDRVADGTLLLVLQRQRDVAPEGHEAVDQAAVLCGEGESAPVLGTVAEAGGADLPQTLSRPWWPSAMTATCPP